MVQQFLNLWGAKKVSFLYTYIIEKIIILNVDYHIYSVVWHYTINLWFLSKIIFFETFTIDNFTLKFFKNHKYNFTSMHFVYAAHEPRRKNIALTILDVSS